MTPAFVQRFAPMLALTDGPTPSAGLAAEQPFDGQGTPLPYLQNQGGPRQYFGTPGPDGLRGRLPVDRGAMSPPDGLRGRLPVMPGDTVAPQNILTQPGRRGNTARIPPQQSQADIDAQTRGGAGFTRVPPANTETYMNLGEMLSHFNFQIPSFLSNTADGLHNAPGTSGKDTTGSKGPRGSVSTATSFNVSSTAGLSDFNRRMGLNLTNQLRTQAEQESLFRRGLTPARTSRHQTGEAVDIRPRDIGGLVGQAAVDEIQRRLRDAGYTDTYVQWETGHGRNQGTGPHVHVQMAARRR